MGDHWEAVITQSSVVMGTGTVLKRAWMRKDAGAAKLGTSSVGWEDLRKQADQSVTRFMSAATTSSTVQMELMKENVPSANLGPFTATVTGVCLRAGVVTDRWTARMAPMSLTAL